MIFPWQTLLGLLIQHGPTVVSKVKQVITDRTEKKAGADQNDQIHRLEAIVERLNIRNDQLQQDVEQIRQENQNLQKIVQWLVFYVVIVSLVLILWIIFSFKNS